MTPRPRPGSAASHPRFFRSAAQLRTWLEANHDCAADLWIGMYRKHTGRPSITWPEAVDQLLCFGWIDGIRKSLDGEAYVNRATPRRAGSNWSAVNLRRVDELRASGLMAPAGIAAWQARDPARCEQHSLEREHAAFSKPIEAEFRRNRDAWAFWQAQPPGYRRTSTWWVMSAKKEETRRRRLQQLIEAAAAGRRGGPAG